MKLQNTSTDKLGKVEKALKLLLESNHKGKPEVRKAIKKLSTTRETLKEATLQTATVNQKDPRKEDSVLSVDPTSQSTLNTLKSLKNTADVTIGGRKLEEQENRDYSSEEAEAVGKALLKPLVAATRNTSGEIGKEPTVNAERNKVSIHLVYGQGKGEDTFHFVLRTPSDNTVGKVYMKLDTGEEEVAPFEVTESNDVKFNPQVNLEERFKDLLVKYTAANSKETKNIDDFIAERKQAIRESFGQPALEEDRRGTFTIKGLGTFNNLGIDGDFVKGSQNNGPVRTFTKKRVMDDNPDFLKPAPRAPRAPRPPKMTERQYWQLLQGAVDDAGTNRYAHDMAESMILDDSLVRYLKSEYPDLKTPDDFLERLQWDLEACEPEGEDAYGYDDDEDEIVPEVASKPDYIDFDKDGDRKETMKKAVQDKELAEDFDIGHEDDEPNMLKAEIYKLLVASSQLYKILSTFDGKGEVDFPQWWQAKIIQAADNVKSAKDYLEFDTIKPQLDVAINTLG